MIQFGKALAIARVNLVQQLRDRSDLFPVFVLPTIIIIVLGLQFAGVTRARLGVVSPTGDAAAASLVQAFAADTAEFEVRPIVDEATLRAEVEHGQLEAGIVIPVGFQAALHGAATVQVAYLGTPGALTLGLRAPVEAIVSRMGAVTTATRVAVADGAGDWTSAAAAAAAAYGSVPGVHVALAETGDTATFAGFGQFAPGASMMLILFTFQTSLTAAARLIHSRQIGVSRRMIATPTSAWTIVVGEALGRFAIALLQAVYIVLVSSALFGVSWGTDPLAAGLLIALFCAVAAGAAMLLGAVGRNLSQVASRAAFAGLALALLGGCMIPFQSMPSQMQAIARLIPHSWAVLGLQTLIRDGGGLASVVPNLVVLASFALVLLGLAAWRFPKSVTG